MGSGKVEAVGKEQRVDRGSGCGDLQPVARGGSRTKRYITLLLHFLPPTSPTSPILPLLYQVEAEVVLEAVQEKGVGNVSLDNAGTVQEMGHAGRCIVAFRYE